MLAATGDKIVGSNRRQKCWQQQTIRLLAATDDKCWQQQAIRLFAATGKRVAYSEKRFIKLYG
jgi:hypothetical protein